MQSDDSIKTTSISLSSSTATLFAVIISIVLAAIIGSNLVVAIVYGIDYLYIFIVNHVENVKKYSHLDNT